MRTLPSFFPQIALLQYTIAMLRWRTYHCNKLCAYPSSYNCYTLSGYHCFWNHQHLCKMNISCVLLTTALPKLLPVVCVCMHVHSCLHTSILYKITACFGRVLFFPSFPFCDSNLQCPMSCLCLSRWLQYNFRKKTDETWKRQSRSGCTRMGNKGNVLKKRSLFSTFGGLCNL